MPGFRHATFNIDVITGFRSLPSRISPFVGLSADGLAYLHHNTGSVNAFRLGLDVSQGQWRVVTDNHSSTVTTGFIIAWDRDAFRLDTITAFARNGMIISWLWVSHGRH